MTSRVAVGATHTRSCVVSYEPPQINDGNVVSLLEDPKEAQVDRILGAFITAFSSPRKHAPRPTPCALLVLTPVCMLQLLSGCVVWAGVSPTLPAITSCRAETCARWRGCS